MSLIKNRIKWMLVFFILIMGFVFAQDEAAPDAGDEKTKTQVSEAENNKAISTSATSLEKKKEFISKRWNNKKKRKIIQDSSWEVNTYLSYLGLDNLDLRAVDNSSQSRVLETDDRVQTGVLSLQLRWMLLLPKGINFYNRLEASRLLGGDLPQYSSEVELSIREIYLEAPFYQNDTSSIGGVMGRMKYSSGYGHKTGLFLDRSWSGFSPPSYIFSDHIDGLVFWAGWNFLRFEVFADLFSMNANLNSVYWLRNWDDNNEFSTDGFDGDVNTYRYGLLVDFSWDNVPKKKVKLGFKPYLLFSRIGGTGVGADVAGGTQVAMDGARGNFVDNDFVLVAGGAFRLNLRNIFKVYLEGAYSHGEDRREVESGNVDLSGGLFHGYLQADLWQVLRLYTSGLFVTGAETDADGNFVGSGFVSMKGTKLGGIIFQDYYGIYPSTIVDFAGIVLDPYNVNGWNRQPISAVSLGLEVHGLSFKKKTYTINADPSANSGDGLGLGVEGWGYWDMSENNTDYSGQNPDSEAQNHRRLGQFMGIEVNAFVSYTFLSELIKVKADGAVFVPYDFYLIPLSSRFAPHGNELAYVYEISTEFKF